MSDSEKPTLRLGHRALCLLAAGVFLTVSAMSTASGSDQIGASPHVGETAPDFRLPYATADTVMHRGQSLTEAIRQGPVLLAFYPADWSPGCTKEVCTLRDSFADLGKLKITVWGISGDNVYSHRAWAQYHKLPFRLLSDVKHEVAEAYGIFDPNSGFNRRTVFVVGTDGKIKFFNPQYAVTDSMDFHILRKALVDLGKG